ncbi:hypothetical protein HYALB_00008857 [Hymenoscyphus albidus]|uniref:Uncharacterized protein n=1 Tax=Hymenoscyphus albidus TaxID=595503 RepID=A0A9N9LQR9_9HELO|nr:hypothetical protein HYALB_00008857 [Hymenoscyphus albidus]
METENCSVGKPITEDLRLVGLMQGLKAVAKLQQEISNTQIAFREKRREASLKREAVSESDAKSMREVQRLIASGEFPQFQELANDCQKAGDALGPVEEEGIIAEQQLEGQIWTLQQAERRLYEEFECEFQTAARYSSSPSVESSDYELPSNLHNYEGQFENDIIRHDENFSLSPSLKNPECASPSGEFEPPRSKGAVYPVPTFPGLEEKLEHDVWSDSGVTGIKCGESDTGQPKEYISDFSRKHYKSDLYINLLTDFASKRDRINKWLEKNALEFRIEATSIFNILGEVLRLESQEMPSNWSQLVIAYWELDAAAVSRRMETNSDEI